MPPAVERYAGAVEDRPFDEPARYGFEQKGVGEPAANEGTAIFLRVEDEGSTIAVGQGATTIVLLRTVVCRYLPTDETGNWLYALGAWWRVHSQMSVGRRKYSRLELREY